ncbi:MAG: PLP-dependent aminotransferase family protein [Deferribacterales bacterium]
MTMKLYESVADNIREKILCGLYPVGSSLPSIKQLMNEHNVGKNSVISALQILEDKMLIKIFPRKRPVVTGPVWSALTSFKCVDWKKYLDVGKHIMTDIGYAVPANRDKPSLNISEPKICKDFDNDKIIQKALNKVSQKLSDPFYSYYDYRGNPAVRQKVCEKLASYGVFLTPDEVLINSGPREALLIIARGMLSQGMDLYFSYPNFIKTHNIFKTVGMNLVPVKSDKYGMLPEELDRTIHKSRKGVLFINSVTNWPSDTIMPTTRARDLFSIIEKRRIPAIELDVMREYTLSSLPNPLKSFDTSGSIVYIYSFPWILYCGLHVSAITGSKPVINRLAGVKLQNDAGSDIISQIILGELLSDGMFENYMAEKRPQMLKRRDDVNIIMKKYLFDIATWNETTDGICFWVSFDSRINVNKMNLMDKNIFFSYGNMFDPNDTTHMHICYTGMSLDAIEFCIANISAQARIMIDNSVPKNSRSCTRKKHFNI